MSRSADRPIDPTKHGRARASPSPRTFSVWRNPIGRSLRRASLRRGSLGPALYCPAYVAWPVLPSLGVSCVREVAVCTIQASEVWE